MPWHDTGERVGEHFTGYVGLAFREAKARYAPELAHDVARYLWNTLLGSMRTDANRFNMEGEFGAVYMSLDPKTPIRELERTYRRHAGTARPEDISADRILITLDVRLARVADLRDPDVCATWGIGPDEITSDDIGPCQQVARQIRRTHEALRYRSATGAGENLALFYDRLLGESSVSLLRVEPLELPW